MIKQRYLQHLCVLSHAFFSVVFFSGCGTTSRDPSIDEEKFHKRDMQLEIDDKDYRGIAVLEDKSFYEIEGETKSSIEFLKIHSCHREYTEEKSGKSFDYDYAPLQIERELPCPLLIGGFDEKGQHSWAYIDFKRGETLDASMDCNGKTIRLNGVSVCQARNGLVQRLKFDEKVSVKTGSSYNCTMPDTYDDGITWEYKMNIGTCLYVFYSDSGEIHRHVTLGYDAIMLRKL